MRNLPIEKQVCSLEQAKELAELLGGDAPESLWVWVKNEDMRWLNRPVQRNNNFPRNWKQIAAYTGDELGILLKNSAKWKVYPGYYTAKYKAAIAIKGLTEGWIKKESFKYE